MKYGCFFFSTVATYHLAGEPINLSSVRWLPLTHSLNVATCTFYFSVYRIPQSRSTQEHDSQGIKHASHSHINLQLITFSTSVINILQYEGSMSVIVVNGAYFHLLFNQFRKRNILFIGTGNNKSFYSFLQYSHIWSQTDYFLISVAVENAVRRHVGYTHGAESLFSF